MLEWAFTHPEFKTQLFRFVDVFPQCRDAADVLRHVSEYFDGVPVPRALELGLDVADQVPLGSVVSAAVARRNIRRMARQFIAGEDPHRALVRLRRLWDAGEAITVDLLGERVVSEPEAQRYADRVVELVDVLTAGTRGWPARRPPGARPVGCTPTRGRVGEADGAVAALRSPHGAGSGGRRDGAAAPGARPRTWWGHDGAPRHRARRSEGPRVRAAAPPGCRVPGRRNWAVSSRPTGRTPSPISASWWRGRRPPCGCRSGSVSSRAPTGTTRRSSRPRPDGHRRCSRGKPRPTRTSSGARGT